jgi:hypothetical protein
VLLLASTSDKLRLTTSAAVNLDVHASFADYNGSSVTPGRLNTPISSATTSDVVASPGSGVYRTVKTLTARNRSSTTACDVTVIHTDGTNAMELYKATIGPGGHLHYTEETGFFVQSAISLPGDPWAGSVIACVRDGNPNYALNQMQLAGNVAPTPTNIGATVARCELFRPAYDITVNRIRWYGVGVVSAIYTAAIYRLSDLARVSEQWTLTTASATWGSAAAASPFTLTAGALYFAAVSANTTGTTAGIGSIGGTIAAATGQIATAPGALPGNLDVDVGDISSYRFQFAVTAGAMPATAPALAAQAAWTGGMPAFWLDNNSAA